MRIGGYKFRQRCVVIKDLSENILMGSDALVNHGMTLHFGLKTLSVGKISVEHESYAVSLLFGDD